MAIHLKGHTKFPLGQDACVTVSIQNSELQINILKCRVIQSFTDPNQSIVVPTRFGVTLTLYQFQELIKHVPLMTQTMLDLQRSSIESSSEIVQRQSIDQPSTSSNTSGQINPAIPVEHQENTTAQQACGSSAIAPTPRKTILLDNPLPLVQKRRGRPPSKKIKINNNNYEMEKKNNL